MRRMLVHLQKKDMEMQCEEAHSVDTVGNGGLHGSAPGGCFKTLIGMEFEDREFPNLRRDG